MSNTLQNFQERYSKQLTHGGQVLSVMALMLVPQLAAAAPWNDMADFVIELITNGFSRSIAILVCIVLGYLAWAGKLTAAVAGRFIVGIVFIFSAATIVDLFSGAVS